MQVELSLVRLFNQRLPVGAMFSDRTAAWLHGVDLPPCDPVEVTLPRLSPSSRAVGVSLTRSDVPPAETCVVRGLPAISPTRTIADLGRRLPEVEAVVVIDMALHRRLVSLAQLERWADDHPRYRGIWRLRRALQLADGAAESPMETRLRLLLLANGLPRPILQIRLYDDTGFFLARPDLYFASGRLAIEYDGATHRDSFAADNRRQNRLLEAGYKLLRFTAQDIFRTPASVVGQVERALRYSSGSPN